MLTLPRVFILHYLLPLAYVALSCAIRRVHSFPGDVAYIISHVEQYNGN
jgi:hypothetical protein